MKVGWLKYLCLCIHVLLLHEGVNYWKKSSKEHSDLYEV